MADASEANISSAPELLAAGRRHLAVRDYNAAAEALAKACELLAKEHGDTADECAEAYLWYGKALLGLAREESGVLGDGVPGSGNADEEDDDDEDEEEVADEEQNGDLEMEAEVKSNVEKGSGESVNSTVGGVKKIEAESTTKEAEPSSSVANEPGTSNGEDLDESVANLDNEDDVDNLQLAWEMLELARGILSRRGGGGGAGEGAGAGAGALADALLALGEVALESETYDKAVQDMVSCLEIQKTLYPSDDRRIAETHYQIGLANSLASNFEEAITHFKNAANILETRMKSLERAKGGEGEGEAKELGELLPEIREKIQDMMEYKAETMRRVRETLSRGEGSGGGGPSSSSPSPSPSLCPPASSPSASSSPSPAPAPSPAPSDISHLVRRKRKASGDGACPKRPHC